MIEASGLTKRYGRTLAVDDLSFGVRAGHVTGFLGPNGAGKSTTMRLMIGLDHDSGRGRTTFDGQTYRELPRASRRVGTLMEAKAFHPTRSARNHLRMLAAAGGVSRGRVDDVIGLVGLESVAGREPKGFSLGMTQRLGLAAALLGEPDVLLLDEPANGLDPQGVSWLRGFLRDYAAGGRTVFISSHVLAEMAQLADHLVVIGRGRLIDDTSTADFLVRSSQTSVVVRAPESQRLAETLRRAGGTVSAQADGAWAVSGLDQLRVAELAHAEGILLHELTTRVATLEQAFLEATAEAQDYQAGPQRTRSAP